MCRIEYLIDFARIAWESPAPGIRYKEHSRGSRRIRLVEFSEEFNEKDWCTEGHVGYVLEGSLTINFDGSQIEFRAGDGLFIPEGKESKHKGRITKGERALVVLFEEI